jgi:hypothetical protein
MGTVGDISSETTGRVTSSFVPVSAVWPQAVPDETSKKNHANPAETFMSPPDEFLPLC